MGFKRVNSKNNNNNNNNVIIIIPMVLFCEVVVVRCSHEVIEHEQILLITLFTSTRLLFLQ